MPALAFVLAACADFGLEERRFRCDGDPNICGDGWVCGADGFCTRGDAGPPPPDAPFHCDAALECDDDNPCTTGSCGDGTCTYEPVEENASCGGGCLCRGATPTEAACGDRIDNDDDGRIDCNDDDCPACMGGLICCPGGACDVSCE